MQNDICDGMSLYLDKYLLMRTRDNGLYLYERWRTEPDCLPNMSHTKPYLWQTKLYRRNIVYY